MWEALARVGAIENADASTIPSGSEYWSGVTWITLPPQSAKLGTNSHHTDDGTLYAAWTPSALGPQEVLQQHGLREELNAVAFSRVAAPEEHSRLLEEFGLVNDGELAIPVIRAGSRLCVEGGRLAARVARTVIAAEGMQEIVRLTEARSESVAMIMAYHWVYPAILSRLEAGGLKRPAVLAGESGATLAPSLYMLEGDAACVSGSD